MHRLDGHINDIEPRIEAIYENVAKQEEPSLQESLCSYGWILLDSWVAWRTLRFILRNANISERVKDKWFQTPSSYTASQIKAIWDFSDEVENFIKGKTDKKLKELFDNTIQSKRNASAHFTRKTEVKGQDAQLIKKIYNSLSTVFGLYENYYFFIEVRNVLEKRGYSDFSVEFQKPGRFSLEKFKDSVEEYNRSDSYQIFCKDSSGIEYVILVSKEGCEAGINRVDSPLIPVSNDVHDAYYFLHNKGYYQNYLLFIDSILKCWTK